MEDSNHFIWIRHANKQYCNGKASDGLPQHDSPIREDCDEDIFKTVDSLVKKYGFPTKIICSPFLRTRQTKDKMLLRLDELDSKRTADITLEYSFEISEYLGFQKPFGQKADVEEDTLHHSKCKILLGESLKNLNLRVRQHIQNLQITKQTEKRCVWVITHGIILNNVFHNLNLRFHKRKEYLNRPASLSYVSFTFFKFLNSFRIELDLKP